MAAKYENQSERKHHQYRKRINIRKVAASAASESGENGWRRKKISA